MNRNITLRILVAALVVTFVVSMGPLAQTASRKCSLSKLAGAYGLTTTRSIPGIGPVAAVGSITFDASGNILGSSDAQLEWGHRRRDIHRNSHRQFRLYRHGHCFRFRVGSSGAYFNFKARL